MNYKVLKQKNVNIKPRIVSVEPCDLKYKIIRPSQFRDKKFTRFRNIENKVDRDVYENRVSLVYHNQSVCDNRSNSANINDESKAEPDVITLCDDVTDNACNKKPKYVLLRYNTKNQSDANISCLLSRQRSLSNERRVAGPKFDKPEYNSIRCTIKKINEIQREEPVKDIKSLPDSFRKVVSKKVSASLNCPRKQIIYKDLIDLTFDEEHLLLPNVANLMKMTARSAKSYKSARSIDGISPLQLTDSSMQMSSQHC